MTEKIERWFKDRNIQILGKVVFNKAVVKSIVEGKTIIEYSNNQVTKTLRSIWSLLKEELERAN
ncbi:hypothetical protein ES707_21925 [subsurface metagenome]